RVGVVGRQLDGAGVVGQRRVEVVVVDVGGAPVVERGGVVGAEFDGPGEVGDGVGVAAGGGVGVAAVEVEFGVGGVEVDGAAEHLRRPGVLAAAGVGVPAADEGRDVGGVLVHRDIISAAGTRAPPAGGAARSVRDPALGPGRLPQVVQLQPRPVVGLPLGAVRQ